jgi:hypothetical protein
MSGIDRLKGRGASASTKPRYQVYIKDVTFGSWTIEAENEDEARAITDARLLDGDTSWHSGPPGDDGYIEVVEIAKLE